MPLDACSLLPQVMNRLFTKENKMQRQDEQVHTDTVKNESIEYIKQQNDILLKLVNTLSEHTLRLENTMAKQTIVIDSLVGKVDHLERLIESQRSPNTDSQLNTMSSDLYEFEQTYNREQVKVEPKQIFQLTNGFTTTPLNQFITSDSEFVTFKLNSICSFKCVQLGILRDDDCNCEGAKYLGLSFPFAYSIDLFDGHKRKGPDSCGSFFPKDVKSGDEIQIRLDLKNRNLSYYLNTHCVGIAFDNLDVSHKWIFAVTLWYSGDTVSLK